MHNQVKNEKVQKMPPDIWHTSKELTDIGQIIDFSSILCFLSSLQIAIIARIVYIVKGIYSTRLRWCYPTYFSLFFLSLGLRIGHDISLLQVHPHHNGKQCFFYFDQWPAAVSLLYSRSSNNSRPGHWPVGSLEMLRASVPFIIIIIIMAEVDYVLVLRSHFLALILVLCVGFNCYNWSRLKHLTLSGEIGYKVANWINLLFLLEFLLENHYIIINTLYCRVGNRKSILELES